MQQPGREAAQRAAAHLLRLLLAARHQGPRLRRVRQCVGWRRAAVVRHAIALREGPRLRRVAALVLHVRLRPRGRPCCRQARLRGAARAQERLLRGVRRQAGQHGAQHVLQLRQAVAVHEPPPAGRAAAQRVRVVQAHLAQRRAVGQAARHTRAHEARLWAVARARAVPGAASGLVCSRSQKRRAGKRSSCRASSTRRLPRATSPAGPSSLKQKSHTIQLSYKRASCKADQCRATSHQPAPRAAALHGR